MLRYLLRRLVMGCLLIVLVSSGAFVLTRLAPGDFTSEMVSTGATRDAMARERARYGLDRPIAQQYLQWLGRGLRLELGPSILYGRQVSELLGERAANTAMLAVVSLLLATLVGMPLGVFTGSRRDGPLPALVRGASLVFVSVPPLVLSIGLTLVAVRTGWFPVGGMTAVDRAGLNLGLLGRAADLAWHLTLPSLALGLPIAAALERLQSQAMTESLQSPFIVAAAARGVSQRRLVWRHALRDALRPVMGVYGIVIGSLFSGSFAVEIVTAWPGLGRLLYDALVARDIYLVAGCAGVGSLFLVAGTLAADLGLLLIDPRLRERELGAESVRMNQ